MRNFKIIIVNFLFILLFSSCNRKNSVEIIKSADHITYSNKELNQKIRIGGISDTAIVLKELFLDIYNNPKVKNLSFRDATDVNKIVFYYGEESATTWINCLNKNKIVFGIEEEKFVLDSITEIEAIQKVTTLLGVKLFEQ